MRVNSREYKVIVADDWFADPAAAAARRFFEGLQHLDWARPEGLTKTQFMYAGS